MSLKEKNLIFVLVLFLFSNHFSHIFGDDDTTEADAIPSEDSSQVNSNNGQECAKHCQSSSSKKYQQQCSIFGFKSVENVTTHYDCLSKCKSTAFCVSAIFTKPRIATTYDLQSLYNKVINSETWMRAQKRANNYANYENKISEIMNGDLDSEQQNRDDFDLDHTNYPPINITLTDTISGSCYLYDTNTSPENKLKCSESQLTFEYNELECYEDLLCSTPKRNCSCGYCGPNCKQLNYVRIPNSCMGKYYFGHLIAKDLDECIKFCLETKGCKSIDLGNKESCLINYVDRSEMTLMLGCDSKNKEMWDYYEIKCDSECQDEKPRPPAREDTCRNAPTICQNGGICDTIQLPPPAQAFTYACNCPCNWCGHHCEKLNMKTYKNGCLNGSVLAWSVATTSGDCIDMCLNEIHCKSVSYSATAGTCVLHWTDSSNESLVVSPKCPSYRIDIEEREWTFYETICNSSSCHSDVESLKSPEVIGCVGNPCQNGGKCADIFRNGYIVGFHCLCKCGYCGDLCEIQNYAVTSDACIWGSHVSKMPNEYYLKGVTLNTCLDFCAQKYPLCRSIDLSNKGECFLNSKDSDLAEISPKCNNYLRQQWNLYDINCVCNNKPIKYLNQLNSFEPSI